VLKNTQVSPLLLENLTKFIIVPHQHESRRPKKVTEPSSDMLKRGGRTTSNAMGWFGHPYLTN
jgi:hypothetical protein